MKVLFIFPNYDCPLGLSIGVSYLSSTLQQEGFETSIIHINEEIGYPFDMKRILNDIELINPNYICISTGENHYSDMRELSYRIKEKLNIPIVIGGIYATLNPESVLTMDCPFDFLIRGEGEWAIKDLMVNLQKGNAVTDIPNVWMKSNDKIIKNPMRRFINYFELPYMDLDNWDFEKITKLRRGWVNVSMNRGCPYRCTFCHNLAEVKILKNEFNTRTTGNKELGYLRLRDIDNMIKELKYIKDKYDFVKAFSFIDDTFTYDKEYMKIFFMRYKDEIGLPFVCLTTINDVDDELLELMKSANCDLIRFGVESTTKRICNEIIKRRFSEQTLRHVFDKCNQIGLRTFSYNIIAHPTETKEEMLNTIKLNAEIKPSGIRISLGYPYKGTEYYDIAKKMGMLNDNIEYHNYTTGTKFKFTEEEKLWIDKFKSFFWWWLNAEQNTELYEIYQPLINQIESIPLTLWYEKKEEILDNYILIDRQISEKLLKKNIPHYNVPFDDRPDIALYQNKHVLKKEMLDEH